MNDAIRQWLAENGPTGNVAPWMLGLDGRQPPSLRLPEMSPEQEASFIQPAGVPQRPPTRMGGPDGPSEEGPAAFNERIAQPFFEFMVPQTPTDLALAGLLGPARMLRPLSAAALAMMPGDAEANWLNPRQVFNLASAGREAYATSRFVPEFDEVMRGVGAREGERALDGLNEAQRLLQGNRQAQVRLSAADAFPAGEVNAAFRDATNEIFPQTGWIRTPHDWLYGLAPGRHNHNNAAYNSTSQAWQQFWRPAYAGPGDDPNLRTLFEDPLLVAAESGLRNVRGAMSPVKGPGDPLGWVSEGRADDGNLYTGYRAGLSGREFESTRRHEADHLLSQLRNDPPQYWGSNTESAWARNPELQEEALRTMREWDMVPPDQAETFARHALYRTQPGEALARGTEALYDQFLNAVPPRERQPFSTIWPDFRVR